MFVFRKPLFSVIMAPTSKSSDAGSVSKPKRNPDVLSISEKGKFMDMMVIGKKNRTRRLLYGKNEFSIREVMENKERTSLFYRRLRIRLKRQNPLISYVRDRIHCKCTM